MVQWDAFPTSELNKFFSYLNHGYAFDMLYSLVNKSFLFIAKILTFELTKEKGFLSLKFNIIPKSSSTLVLHALYYTIFASFLFDTQKIIITTKYIKFIIICILE